MTSPTPDATPRCFICGTGTPGTVHLTASAYVCHDHARGTGRLYLEGDTDD